MLLVQNKTNSKILYYVSTRPGGHLVLPWKVRVQPPCVQLHCESWPCPVPGTGRRKIKAWQVLVRENSVCEIIMYHSCESQRKNGNGGKGPWRETDEQLSLERVIFQLSCKDCIRVGHLKRGGGQSMWKGPEARESLSCLVNRLLAGEFVRRQVQQRWAWRQSGMQTREGFNCDAEELGFYNEGGRDSVITIV